MSGVEAHETEYSSHDGILVPISIMHRKGLDVNGRNPTLLQAYGSYGISLSPTYRPSMLAWLERGGVWAVAHIRGGGENGKEWHLGGHMETRENTIADFIAAAHFLIEQRYTSPEYLAGRGGSAGGIPTGGSLVRHPELWAVMIMNVAVTNFLRFEFSENGPPNIPEFGSIVTEEGFRALRIIDSYTRVEDGVPYPACLITTGLNDPRVVVWQATKMAARLQAATNSGRPILLRVEEQGGHGMGSTRSQVDRELADTLAFILDQVGKPVGSAVSAT
jgi:prolyl oligopeptidase